MQFHFSPKKNGHLANFIRRKMIWRKTKSKLTTRPGATKTKTFDKNQEISQLIQQQPARQSSERAKSNATTTPAAKGRGSALKALKPLPSPDSEVKRGRGRPSSGPKPMRIEYEKPGRPKITTRPRNEKIKIK